MNTVELYKYSLDNRYFSGNVGYVVFDKENRPMLYEYDKYTDKWFFMDELTSVNGMTLIGIEKLTLSPIEKYLLSCVICDYLNGKSKLEYNPVLNYELLVSPKDTPYEYEVINLNTVSLTSAKESAKLYIDDNLSLTIIQTLLFTTQYDTIINCGTTKAWDL